MASRTHKYVPSTNIQTHSNRKAKGTNVHFDFSRRITTETITDIVFPAKLLNNIKVYDLEKQI